MQYDILNFETFYDPGDGINKVTCQHMFYLQSAKSTFDKRKKYKPPPTCVPKKRSTTPDPAAAQAKQSPVFVQVFIMKPRDVFVSLLTYTFKCM